jgi:hypothetical protein
MATTAAWTALYVCVCSQLVLTTILSTFCAIMPTSGAVSGARRVIVRSAQEFKTYQQTSVRGERLLEELEGRSTRRGIRSDELVPFSSLSAALLTLSPDARPSSSSAIALLRERQLACTLRARHRARATTSARVT